MIIINLIIDKSTLCYKITINKTYHILNYTRIKPRSRPPQKKSAYVAHPDFSVTKIGKKKCANYASKYGIFLFGSMHDNLKAPLLLDKKWVICRINSVGTIRL